MTANTQIALVNADKIRDITNYHSARECFHSAVS